MVDRSLSWSMAKPGAGYSGKPLAEKLGLKPGMRAYVEGAPEGYLAALDAPEAVEFRADLRKTVVFAQIFVDARARLARRFPVVADRVDEGGMVWVCWPKKSSGVVTDVSEDVLRDVVLPLGWVDVKVAAVDAVWSGLMFRRRRAR